MIWHWYIARESEIFLDLDSRLAVTYAVARLRRAIRRKALPVESVHLFRSYSKNKFHILIFLRDELPADHRALWGLWLGSDKVRGIYTLERLRRGIEAADLLIVRKPYASLRPPDFTCECSGKHKPRRITNHCPVMQSLHGDEAGAEYFPRKNDRKPRKKGPMLPVGGKVPLSVILKS